MKISAKKLVSLLSVSLVLIGLAACGSSSKDDGGSSSDEVTISEDKTKGAMEDYEAGTQFKATEPFDVSIMFSDHPNYPFNKDWSFLKTLEEKTNVSFDTTIIPMSDYEQKRSLLISSGDSPIIIPKTYPGQESTFVSSGAILPVSDYLEYMPNFNEKVKKWNLDADIDTLRQYDGKFYVLPGLHENVWQDYTLSYRTDILKENNLEIPKTWDEFYTVLKTLKEKYPDKTPFSDRWQGKALLGYAAVSFGTKGGWEYNALTFDEDAGKFVYTGTTDEYKEMLTFFNKLISEGLMDKESFTQDDDVAVQKFVSGDSFVMSANGQELIGYEKTMDSTLGEGNYEIAKGLVPEGPAGAVIKGSKLENGLMISSKIKDNDNFKAILQFIDWLWYSDEGQVLAKWGVEGETYTLEDGKYTLTKDINFKGLNPAGTKDLQKDFGLSGGVFAYGGTTELLQSTMSEKEVAWMDELAANRTSVALEPPAPFDDLQREQATLIGTPVKDYVDQGTLQFIVGQRDLSEWDKFVKEVEDKGATKYIDMANEAYENYKKNNK